MIADIENEAVYTGHLIGRTAFPDKLQAVMPVRVILHLTTAHDSLTL